MTAVETRTFWEKFLRAVGTEPRESTEIVGASGLSHPVLALGVDDATKRLVVVSGDHDARASAMMQTDIEGTLPGVHVAVARPIAVGLPVVAAGAIEFFGKSKITLNDLKVFSGKGKRQKQRLQELQEILNKVATPSTMAFGAVPLNILSQVLHVIKQLTYIEVQMGADAAGQLNIGEIDLSGLAFRDLMETDRDVGVCALPLYSFTEADWNIFQSDNTQDISQHLKSLGIYQYFYPAADQAALGLVDRAEVPKRDIGTSLQRLPEMGHPIGDSEIVSRGLNIDRMVGELQDRGLIVEGSLSFSLSEEGNKVRGQVKFRPREGAISKLVNRLRLSVSIRNYFKL